MEQFRERSSAFLAVVAIEKGAFWSPSTTYANFTFYLLLLKNMQINSFFIRKNPTELKLQDRKFVGYFYGMSIFIGLFNVSHFDSR